MPVPTARVMPLPRTAPGMTSIILAFQGFAMEAEQLNLIAGTLADLEARAAELRRYL